MVVSKHVAVYIAQTECCDIYSYGIDCAFVGYSEELSKLLAVNCVMVTW
jgi:hypothetical protein